MRHGKLRLRCFTAVWIWSRDSLLLLANPLLASWPSGHTGRRDRKENSRQSVGVRQVVDEAIARRKACNTREEMKGLIIWQPTRNLKELSLALFLQLEKS